jgi:hypothetical protein
MEQYGGNQYEKLGLKRISCAIYFTISQSAVIYRDLV